ncbi:MAG: hypothetical protein J6Z11_10540, partial [Candidatus Riflebacteria bacterium]|nr:hypothetical protein [Candidatus Riflebacteria bacterium]
MSEDPKKIEETEHKEIVNTDKDQRVPVPAKPWDEARVVVFLIGICLLIEGLLIFYQAGSSQVLVASVIGLGGLVMMLMAWLLPFDIEELEEPDEAEILEEKETKAISEETQVKIKKEADTEQKTTAAPETKEAETKE